MNQETLEGLIECIDYTIAKREKGYAMLDDQYKDTEGNVLSSAYSEYEDRKRKIESRFVSAVLDYQQKVDSLCKKVRSKQPVLTELTPEHINKNGRFPRRIALGKYRITYENLDIYIPKMFRFPFKDPMFICDGNQMALLHKVVLRLLFALPAVNQEYYVFDPNGLGKSMWVFNRLFSNERLFPQKKIMSNCEELKTALKSVMEYMQGLYSYTFNLETDCPDWDSYNRRLYSQKETQKMLPYKIFVFLDVPDAMDSECFDMFRRLLLHCEECGFLVLFSFNEVLLEAEESRMRVQELQLRNCVEASVPLHRVFDTDNHSITLEKLNIQSIGEKFPDDRNLGILLESLDEYVRDNGTTMFSFVDILTFNKLFSGKSIESLKIPCGFITTGGTEFELEIGDRYPHYLIGGTSGSGKSNLLHTIITSACWRYSPEELRVYLLDFKEGVEFKRYADPILKNAALVATEADTEYGVSVLRHLIGEMTQRYRIFKDSGCSNLKAYRAKNPTEILPRLLIVIDEFQVLFEGQEKDLVLEMMTSLAKQGRACGIHMILSTQSLSRLDFGTLGTQFAGRVALKCSSEDSKMILGGITTNNEEASTLEVPYAILNTSQGRISGNVKFAVPEAKSEMIGKKISEIARECERRAISSETKIFEGQHFPALPRHSVFENAQGMVIVLGEKLTYEADFARVVLKDRPENNILLCGHDDRMKQDFILACYLSACGCDECDEFAYIGEQDISTLKLFSTKDKLVSYENFEAFLDCVQVENFSKKRLLLLENLDITKAVGNPPSYPGAKVSESYGKFKSYWDEANRHGSHAVVIYDSIHRLKSGGIPINDFQYRIGYSLNSDEKNYLLNNLGYSSKGPEKGKAFLAENLTVTTWFRPFDNAKG